MDSVGRRQLKTGRGSTAGPLQPDRAGGEAQQAPCSRIWPEGMGQGCRRQKRGEKRR